VFCGRNLPIPLVGVVLDQPIFHLRPVHTIGGYPTLYDSSIKPTLGTSIRGIGTGCLGRLSSVGTPIRFRISAISLHYLVPSFCKFKCTQLAMLGMQEKCDRDDGVRHQKLQTFEPIALSVADDKIHNQD
jgi:hypothetical protein